MGKVFGVVVKSLGTIVGLVPVLSGLAGLHGETPQQQQESSATAAVAILDEVETVSGAKFAGDTDVQQATRDVVDAVQRFHAIIVARHAAASASPAK